MAKRRKSGNEFVPATRAGRSEAAPAALLDDLRGLIRQTREGVAQAVNSALVLLYWEVGQRIRTEILRHQRAAYGEEILATLSQELTVEFGNGFSVSNLSRMMRLVEAFPDRKVVVAISRHLSWSH